MADNIDITPGSGKTIGTDEVTIGAVSQHVQRVKLVDGTDGGTDLLAGTAARGLQVDPRPNSSRLSATSAGLTIATTAYTANDQLGTILSFTSAVASSGGSGVINGINVLDEGDVMAAFDIVFFRATVTLASDNAAYAVSDADMRLACGIVPMPAPVDMGANRISTLPGLGMPYDCSATTLFAALITRSANAIFTAVTDLVVTLYVTKD